MNDELVEVYWLAVFLLEMLIELDDIPAVNVLTETISRLSRELDMHNIDPDDFEIDVTITHTTYTDDDSPFSDFVNSLFEDES